MFQKTFRAIEDAKAQSDDNFVVPSKDRSAWMAEHLFAVNKDVPGEEMAQLTGDYVTKVFEGPYREMPHLSRQLCESAQSANKTVQQTYFFYTTCPKCAKAYGKNYGVGVAEIH